MKLFIFSLLVFTFLESYSQTCNESNSILSVRKRKVGKTEYVIFTLKKPVKAQIEVDDDQPPFIEDASGETIKVRGCKFKRVKFGNVIWTCQSKMISATTNLIKQVKIIGQFEGQIVYIIGYSCEAKSIVHYEYDDGNKRKIVMRIKG